jgi:ribosomal protein S18 acetylase RimI-like enzyme
MSGKRFCGLLVPDLWLGEQLSTQVWQVKEGVDGESLETLKSSHNTFAYAKYPVSQVATVSKLTDFGFRLVDTGVTLEGHIDKQINPSSIYTRTAEKKDLPAVRGIASSTFCYSRFHLDPLFSDETANAIKAAWASNFFSGKRGDGMIVCERQGVVVGFLQLIWSSKFDLLIDLIAVASTHQGLGIGRQMILHAAKYGTGDGRVPIKISVGTQVANVQSIRLYESLGFRITSAQYVLHYHSNIRGVI